MLEVLARETRQEKKAKGIQIGKKEGDMICYIENFKGSTHKHTHTHKSC
jgi:hypothetical protein